MVTQKGIWVKSKRVMEKIKLLGKESITCSSGFCTTVVRNDRSWTCFYFDHLFLTREKKEWSAIK